VPLIDAIAIVDDLRSRGATRLLAAILARAADREQQLRIDYGSRGYFARREPCVLFQREGDGRARAADAPEDYRGGCSVYAVRPVVCRTYFVTSPAERCRPGNERGRAVFGMTPLNEEIRATLSEKLGEEWLLLPLPLPVGLRWAEILLSGSQLDAADATFWQERVRRAEEMRGRVFAEAWSGPAMPAGRR
jgi:Fe-S-cluster containining protein